MILNVKDPVTVGTTQYPGAAGDGVTDDAPAILGHLLALDRLTPAATGLPLFAGLYFPAGAYRIEGEIEVPWLTNVRIFGDGGRGGQLTGSGDPLGSVIVQGRSDRQIFRFTNRDTASVIIERLGFAWADQQDHPPTWSPGLPVHERQPATYLDPGAVALLFSAGARGVPDGGYYQITIRDCRFERGWRGIAIDDTYDAASIAAWDTHIERCDFHSMRGAAISLVNHPDHYIGMPSNTITDCFVENYSNPDGNSPGLEYSRRNEEPQVRLASQTGMRIDGLDLEGSKTTALYAADSQIAFRALYLEHIKIGYQLLDGTVLVGTDGAPFADVLSLYGGEYLIEGFHIDGTLNAWDDVKQAKTFSKVIFGTAGASVVVSGARARPVMNPTTADLDVADGFHTEQGPCVFLHTNDFAGQGHARFRTAGELHLEASSRSSDPFDLFDGSLDGNTTADEMAARVEREPRGVRVQLSFPAIPAGRVRAHTPSGFAGLPFAGARVGDLVTLGPPSTWPVHFVPYGVVAAMDTVEVRVLNASAGQATPPTGIWTVSFARGANNVLHDPGS